MILELAEHVESATRDAFPEDRTTRFYERPPREPICAAHVRVETIGNDRVTPGAHYDSQLSASGRDARVMHQRRLKSVVSLIPPA